MLLYFLLLVRGKNSPDNSDNKSNDFENKRDEGSEYIKRECYVIQHRNKAERYSHNYKQGFIPNKKASDIANIWKEKANYENDVFTYRHTANEERKENKKGIQNYQEGTANDIEC